MIVVARCLPVVVAVLLALCPRAHADPLTVTSGTITLPSALGSATFTLSGDDFSLSGRVEQSIGQLSCFPCSSTSNVTLHGPLSDITFGGQPGTMNGVTYPTLFFTGLMTVTPPSFPGAMLLESTTVMLPFDFSALLSGYHSGTDAFNAINPIFSLANFTGRGTVTAHFTATPIAPGDAPIFNLHDALYQFSAASAAPTPEPATLVLFGVGAATVFVRRRRRSSAPD